MTKMFYLSIVYNNNLYNRYDILKDSSLQKLDSIIGEYQNREEIIKKYLSDYNQSITRGKICVIYEDLDLKKKELSEDRSNNNFTYAHIIPIMYKNKRLMNIEECLIILKHKLHQRDIIESIMLDRFSRDGKRINVNKRYLFETEEEKDYLYKLCDYQTAMSLFLKRLKKMNDDDKYFYCRLLMNICNLSISTLKIQKGKIQIHDDNIKKYSQTVNSALTKEENIENDVIDMESFYTKYDLDEVIKHSPDNNKPIGSVGKGKK